MSPATCIYCNAREGEHHAPKCPAIAAKARAGTPVVATDPGSVARAHEQAARDRNSRR